ncbi:MAG TPA: GNAT family N-acetyltransferase [Leptolyngbyaceae cyanobacterium]
MEYQTEFGKVANPEEAEKLGKILCQCFNLPASEWPIYRDRINLENFRAIRQSGEVAGGLAIYQMGQWFGGKSLPMAGIAAVGISPEYRGQKIAIELLSNTVRELYQQGIPISSLYPATQRLYRQAGYEQAGSRCYWEVPTQSIKLSERTLPLEKLTTIQPDIFLPIYRQQAIQNNGNLDRHPGIWQRIIEHKEDVVYAYIVGSPTQPEGYIIFSQKIEKNTSYLQIWDWVTLTPAAINRLWTFIGDHRSQIQYARWYAGKIDPRTLLLPEQTANIRNHELWFLRIVNLEKALNLRGYPNAIEAELHLAVKDSLIPENTGNFILQVSNGKGEVTKGGRGDLQLDIRSLAPLYSGLFTAAQLQLTGQIEGTEKSLSMATQLFASSHPWMKDMF